jgi:peptidoglycan hydrolase-like protein with peptidoglycan-binding domain
MTDVKGGYQRPTSTSFISSSFQDHKNRKPVPSQEPGTDYGCAYGSTLFAPENGVVVEADSRTIGADGRRLTIDLDDGQRVSLIHLAGLSVGVGTRVSRGQVIGRTGASAHGKEWGVGAHVHTSLFDKHSYNGFGTNSTIDFERFVGADNDGAGVFVQAVADRQNYLNAARGAGLVVDGILGAKTKAAILAYQRDVLRGHGYTGALDGDWGPGTQAAHEKAYAAWVASTQKPAEPQYHNVTLDDIASIGNVEGLQKIANLYLRQGIDNQWGPKSKEGLQRFLNQNYGGSLTAWLRQKWGYVGNDQFGPNMKAALQRANDANRRAL